MKPTLVVLAAGMGSRFGGLKQIKPFGPNGELILDYTLYDAFKSGFGKIVFVIKKENEYDFKQLISKNLFSKELETEYAFQELNDLPLPYTVPDERSKPWGTGHALYAARGHINGPFGVVGADDFFGRNTFSSLGKFLSGSFNDKSGCMVGFRLKSTLSEHGSVSRGVCEVQNEKLLSITERTDITMESSAAYYTDENGKKVTLSPDSIVSMNVWGFARGIMESLVSDFEKWLKANSTELKREYYLPSFVDTLIKHNELSVSVLPTTSKWYGVTYGSDADILSSALSQMHKNGDYPRLR